MYTDSALANIISYVSSKEFTGKTYTGLGEAQNDGEAMGINRTQ